MDDNLFEIDPSNKSIVENVAEAYGKWKTNTMNYEKVQGIVLDIRYLMMNYLGNHDEDKRILSEAIEKYIITH